MTTDLPQGQLALLVVDDEPLVLREMVRGLARGGQRVLAAGSAQEALALAALHPEIGVVVSDIRMPNEDGLGLARRLLGSREEAAALEIVLVTGHATLEDAAAALGDGVSEVLQKPFRLAELKQAVGRAMDRARARRESASR